MNKQFLLILLTASSFICAMEPQEPRAEVSIGQLDQDIQRLQTMRQNHAARTNSERNLLEQIHGLGATIQPPAPPIAAPNNDEPWKEFTWQRITRDAAQLACVQKRKSSQGKSDQSFLAELDAVPAETVQGIVLHVSEVIQNLTRCNDGYDGKPPYKIKSTALIPPHVTADMPQYAIYNNIMVHPTKPYIALHVNTSCGKPIVYHEWDISDPREPKRVQDVSVSRTCLEQEGYQDGEAPTDPFVPSQEPRYTHEDNPHIALSSTWREEFIGFSAVLKDSALGAVRVFLSGAGSIETHRIFIWDRQEVARRYTNYAALLKELKLAK